MLESSMMPKLLRVDAFRDHCDAQAGSMITFAAVVCLVSFAKTIGSSSGMVWVMG